MMFSTFSEQFLLSQTVFLFFQLQQPTAVAVSYFLSLISTFPDKFVVAVSSFCIYWGCLRVSVVLYSAALQLCQLHFSRMLWVPRLAVPRLAGIFFCQYCSRHLLSVFFPLYQGCLYGCSRCFLALIAAFLPITGPVSFSQNEWIRTC